MSATEGNGGFNRWRIIGWSVPLLLLLAPLVAMQFTREVNWSFGDFLVAAMMFGIVGLMLELVVRVSKNRYFRAGVATAVAASFLLIWSNLAVGFIGNENNPANQLFFAVPALALAGSVLTRFRADGMCWAMVAAAALQFAIPVAVMAFGFGDRDPVRVIEFPVISAVFSGIWLTSAWLFSKAADA